MQIRRATSLIFFRPRLDFLLSVPAVPAFSRLASIDLSFLQLCRDTGLDRSRALFVLFILLSLSISSCLHLIFTSLHPVRAWTLVANFESTFGNGEFLSSKNILFLHNYLVTKSRNNGVENIPLFFAIYIFRSESKIFMKIRYCFHTKNWTIQEKSNYRCR